MEERIYQPSLLWVKAVAYLQQEQPDREIGSTDLNLYVYRTDTTGAYTMHGPKLYWTDNPMTGGSFTNVDQDDMYNNREKLGEVVLWDRRKKKTILLGQTYELAWEKISI